MLVQRVLCGAVATTLTVGGALVASPPALASSTSPNVSLSTEVIGTATSVSAQWVTTPTFTYSGGFIQRFQLNGFTTTGASDPTPCGWISYSDAKTAAGCRLFETGGNTYLDWTAQYNGTVQGTPVTVTLTIPSGYITTPATAGDYSAFSGDETASGPTITMSSPTTVTITEAPTPDPEEPIVERVLPADVIQEFGYSTLATCDAAAPEGLNWAGVPSGGWGMSWGQWMNGGNGGAVCTRTLYYNASTEAWAVR